MYHAGMADTAPMKGTSTLRIPHEEMKAWCQEVLDNRYSSYTEPFGAIVTQVQMDESNYFEITLQGRTEPENKT